MFKSNFISQSNKQTKTSRRAYKSRQTHTHTNTHTHRYKRTNTKTTSHKCIAPIMPSQNVGKYASKPKPKPKPRSKPSAKMAPPKPADKPPKPELPPKERPPREYQKGVQRQAFLTKDANEYNKNPDGKKLQQNWPPMSSTIPAEPDRTNLRAIPYRDWWVAFLLLVCAWFIMAHGDGAAIVGYTHA